MIDEKRLLDCNANNSSFIKGMTLNDYLNEMGSNDSQLGINDHKQEENLYETSRLYKQNISNKLITYEIRETDEENDDHSASQSMQIGEKVEINISKDDKQNITGNEKTCKQTKQVNQIIIPNPELSDRVSVLNVCSFRVRKPENSYLHGFRKNSNSLSPSKNFAKTLYGGEWKFAKETKRKNQASPLTTTLYGKFLKGIKDKNAEKNIRKKNARDLEYVIKYEREINSKYTGFSGSEFRVQGVTDRLLSRNPGAK